MGSFGIWHWIVVLIILSIPVGIGFIIWLVVRAASKPAAPSRPAAPVSTDSQPLAEARLKELASLRSKDLITDSEYERHRAEILRSV